MDHEIEKPREEEKDRYEFNGDDTFRLPLDDPDATLPLRSRSALAGSAL